MIAMAAAGEPGQQAAFAQLYAPAIRAYLAARWAASPLAGEVDDAVQTVFVECIKSGGALARAAPDRPGGFRAFLYGVARNVARRTEAAQAGNAGQAVAQADFDAFPNRDERLSIVFDRAWAIGRVREAAARQRERAARQGGPAARRVELLRLRFEEGLPIRTIAQRWNCPAADLHREYAKARVEFREALLEVLAGEHSGNPAAARQECEHLLSLLA